MYSNKDGLYGIEIEIGSSFFRALKNFRKSYICYNLKMGALRVKKIQDWAQQKILSLLKKIISWCSEVIIHSMRNTKKT